MKITRWILGITGGIAAYKTPELVRLLVKQGSEVKVVMTHGAKSFVTPMTLQAVSRNPVYSDLLDEDFEAAMGHIELARWAQGILIAPLSANRLAALAHGMADDLLTTLCLATQAPIWAAPAMNQQMWHHPATQSNIRILQERGIQLLGPEYGEQACQEIGLGRMCEPEAIVANLFNAEKTILEGKHVLISAGPTQEVIDPVRYLSNRSSGKMGFALAKAAQRMGAKVTLIAGPVSLPTPAHVKRLDVTSAQQMYDVVMKEAQHCDIFISAAAVCDFRLLETNNHKIKKSDQHQNLTLNLVANPDILATVAKLPKRPFCVGFAAETENFEHYARQKLLEKELDLVALNDVSNNEIGFDANDNALTVFSHHQKHEITKNSKENVAIKLLEIIGEYYHAKNKTKST
ncbi:MAG: bifunctional phosphopantothenoylcysteine decarboxylase/phosphopantothenate--cysteine ligase CoaBC [Proteobacteria bacterium]|nr:bifunctional phosphopantothenoylcysteine decarboxylase/phosphopantothenate--cysteine ligase CoaBC [Pseudomonadota bacterium]